jgi:hypothetical protein
VPIAGTTRSAPWNARPTMDSATLSGSAPNERLEWHIAVLPEHIVDVAVLPPGAPASDIVAAGVWPGELAELLLPLHCSRNSQMPRCGALSGRSRSGSGSICHLRPMMSSSSAPSRTAYPAAETRHPWGRCHAGGTRIAFSHNTLASTSVKLARREKPPLPLPPVWAIVRRARERWAMGDVWRREEEEESSRVVGGGDRPCLLKAEAEAPTHIAGRVAIGLRTRLGNSRRNEDGNLQPLRRH